MSRRARTAPNPPPTPLPPLWTMPILALAFVVGAQVYALDVVVRRAEEALRRRNG